MKIDKKVQSFIKAVGSHIVVNGKDYYYMPYWFRPIAAGSDYWIHYSPDELPTEVKEAIKGLREGGNNIFSNPVTYKDAIKP